MSESHSQDENDASKSNSIDALKVNNQDRDNTQVSRDNDRVPSPTPPSAQPGQAPGSQPLPAPKATNPSDQPSPQHRSSSVPARSQKPNEVPRNPDRFKAMSNGQNGQINGNQPLSPPQGPEPDLGSSKEGLEAYDWDELEERFHAEMGKCEEVEKGIQREFDDLLEVFQIWTVTGSQYEEERGSKRLRTRMAFVQQSEKSLETKRLHYVKVVKAFESALALLSDP